MEDEEELQIEIENMYQNYIKDGFDFSTNDTFDEIFKRIFVDAVNLTLNVFEDFDKEANE